jgi:protein gp37
MNKTNIDWTDRTWNPITGCMGPLNKGRCAYCYAHKLARGRLRARYLANPHVAGTDGRAGSTQEA